MFPSKGESSSSQYAPISLQDDGEGSSATLDKRSSFGDDHSAPLLKASDNSTALVPSQPSQPSQLPKLIVYFSLALALLSIINFVILAATLSRYRACPFSNSGLEALPYGDARLGLDRTGTMIPAPKNYHHAWPDRIARVSRKLKNAVWGHGVQVYVTVEVCLSYLLRVLAQSLQQAIHQLSPAPTAMLCVLADQKTKDSTIMRFPIPLTGVNACVVSWRPPPDFSVQAKDVTTKGDVTEIEVWQLIAPSAIGASSSSMVNLDYDTLSYSTLPVRGELLGVLDLTTKPNSTTVEFACPSDTGSLVVEMRCQRVACHVSFMEIDVAPRFGFELLRRKE